MRNDEVAMKMTSDELRAIVANAAEYEAAAVRAAKVELEVREMREAAARSQVDCAMEVVIRDIRIPFWILVALFVKGALAAIPALLILTVLGWLASAIISALFWGSAFSLF